MLTFLLGAMAGVAAATYWHDELSRFLGEHVPRLRNQAADKVQVIGETAAKKLGGVAAQAHSRLRTEQSGPRAQTTETQQPGSGVSGDVSYPPSV